MCKHSIRTQIKPIWIRCIAGWEIFYWWHMGGLIYAWWYYLDTLTIRNDTMVGLQQGEDNFVRAKEEYERIIYDWDVGLWIHIYMCWGFIPISCIIFFAMHLKRKGLLFLYFVLSICWALFRIFWMIWFSRGFYFLPWFEFYWFVRIYFLLSVFNCYLDFWDQETDIEQVEEPLMVPAPLEMDNRDWRRGNGYQEYDNLLDPTPRNYGLARFPLGESHDYDEADERFFFPASFRAENQHGIQQGTVSVWGLED